MEIRRHSRWHLAYWTCLILEADLDAEVLDTADATESVLELTQNATQPQIQRKSVLPRLGFGR